MERNTCSKIGLVTGATGFVGSHLTRRLVDDDWQVHVITRPTSSLRLLRPFLNQVTIHTHDGTMDKMMEIFRVARPTIVFHLASLFVAEHKSSDVVSLIQSNILFATQLVEATVRNDVGYIINTGTSWQHYEGKYYGPVCLYAATKQAFEDIIQFYIESSDLSVITLTLFDTYGPNDYRKKIFSLLKHFSRRGRTLVMSPGEQLLDLVYIDDVVEAYIVAAQRLLSREAQGHEKYAVSSGELIRLRELVEVYSEEMNVSIPVLWGARPYRLREVMMPWSRGDRLPNWSARVSLREGIRRMAALGQESKE